MSNRIFHTDKKTVSMGATEIISKFTSNKMEVVKLKTLAEIAELLNVNIRELLVNTK